MRFSFYFYTSCYIQSCPHGFGFFFFTCPDAKKTLKGVDPLFFVLLLSFLVCNSLVFALKEVRLVICILFIDTGSIKRHVGKLAFRKHLLIRSDKFVLVNFMLAYLPFPSALMLSESGHYFFQDPLLILISNFPVQNLRRILIDPVIISLKEIR